MLILVTVLVLVDKNLIHILVTVLFQISQLCIDILLHAKCKWVHVSAASDRWLKCQFKHQSDKKALWVN